MKETSSGYDKVSPHLLKKAFDLVVPSLADLYNDPLKEALYPKQKILIVADIYKGKGS